MEKILLYKKALLPGGWHENVMVKIHPSGTITAVTLDAEINESKFSPDILLPGMANVHSHCHQRGIAGLSESYGAGSNNFWKWREIMYHFSAKLEPTDMYAIAQYVYIEMLKMGYTSVAEFQYLHNDLRGTAYPVASEMSLAIITAAEKAGISCTILPAMYKYSNFGSQPATNNQARFLTSTDQYLEICSQLQTRAESSELLEFGVAAHSLRAIDHNSMSEVLNGIGQFNLPIHMHVSEQKKEVDDCLAWSGKRPVEWLTANFDISKNWCLVHATHLNMEEVRLLAEKQVVVGLCPTTEANLGDGLFNAISYLQNNGIFGIGSDSNITINPFDELRLLEYGQRLKFESRNILAKDKKKSTGRQLYENAAFGGSRALGRKCGKIDVGFKADLVSIDSSHPDISSREGDTILDTLIFSSNTSVIKDVFVNGVHLIKNGLHDSQIQVAENYRKTLKKISASLP